MALGTLIVGTAKVVGNYIAKNGIAKAIKKFTKNSIAEGKKHYADVIKKDGGKTAEKAANIKKIKPVQAANANSRATLRKGIIGGSVVVGGGVATAYELNKDKKKKKADKDKKKTTKSKTKTYAEMVKEDKAKGKAKVLARRDNSEKPDPKPIPKGLRESIAKDKKKDKPTPKKKPVAKKKVEEKKKKQLMMKEKYTGKDSNVKFNSRGGMLKKGKK